MTIPIRRLQFTDTCRLIPARYPSTGIFDQIARPEDLDAIMELEAWTDDRVSAQWGVLSRLPRSEWVSGREGASVIMAAFCHPRPGGARFSSAHRGAWYCGRTLQTAQEEVIFHRTRELRETGTLEMRLRMRLYLADLDAELNDIREPVPEFEPFHHASSYLESQQLGLQVLEEGGAGIVYRSVRHAGGECVACFRPALVANVRAATHYEFRWEGGPRPVVRQLRDTPAVHAGATAG